jgi:ceramide glucosyltransferase
MDAIAHLAGAFALFALFAHILTTLSARRRCRVPSRVPAAADAPPVTIVRPVCGADPLEEPTLRSTFALDYPSYEVLFCCASPDDPAVPVVRRLIAEHPAVDARLLIGDDRISHNPKLNNMVKGWRAAAHEWIVFADSNVDMPRDYLQRLMAFWGDGTGLVSAPPIGWQPKGLWAEFECAYLNTYQARWQFAADSLGIGFAQGKNMLWRRRDLEAGGGIQALAREPAEDAAATTVVRGLGLQVRLADGAFRQPLGPRTAGQVWRRQVRWARLRRSTFPGVFGLEILSGLAAPLLSMALAAWVFEFDGSDVLAAMGAYAGVWFACEAWLAAAVGWPLSWRSPLLWMLRELLLPVLVLQAWLGNSLSWRGNDWSVEDSDAELRPGALGS